MTLMLSSKPKLDALWQIYDVADTNEEVERAFIARYGREPWAIWRDGGCVHAGPITKEEHDDRYTDKARTVLPRLRG